MKLSGSEIIIESLKKEGVEYIFGYPGGAVLHIYDALFAAEKIKHVLVGMSKAQHMLRMDMQEHVTSQELS